jgi:hypothetical protein
MGLQQRSAVLQVAATTRLKTRVCGQPANENLSIVKEESEMKNLVQMVAAMLIAGVSLSAASAAPPADHAAKLRQLPAKLAKTPKLLKQWPKSIGLQRLDRKQQRPQKLLLPKDRRLLHLPPKRRNTDLPLGSGVAHPHDKDLLGLGLTENYPCSMGWGSGGSTHTDGPGMLGPLLNDKEDKEAEDEDTDDEGDENDPPDCGNDKDLIPIGIDDEWHWHCTDEKIHTGNGNSNGNGGGKGNGS